MQNVYRYLSQIDVHALDCAGRVDLVTGLERIKALKQRMAERPPSDGVAKLLVDFRKAEWASASDHMELSRVTRDAFGLHPGNSAVRVAFLSEARTSYSADNEGWFSDPDEALDWLVNRT